MIGKRLRDLRESRNMKQYEIAQMLNVSREAYSMYESGKRQLSCETLSVLADFYGVTADYILGRNGAVSDEEAAFIKKFRSLDERGRETVCGVLKMEYARYSGKQSKK